MQSFRPTSFESVGDLDLALLDVAFDACDVGASSWSPQAGREDPLGHHHHPEGVHAVDLEEGVVVLVRDRAGLEGGHQGVVVHHEGHEEAHNLLGHQDPALARKGAAAGGWGTVRRGVHEEGTAWALQLAPCDGGH